MGGRYTERIAPSVLSFTLGGEAVGHLRRYSDGCVGLPLASPPPLLLPSLYSSLP